MYKLSQNCSKANEKSNRNIKVELDLSNYVGKGYLKGTSGVDTSN